MSGGAAVLALALIAGGSGALPAKASAAEAAATPDMAGVLNVKTFGAKGDGQADDTRAIQAAFDAVPRDGGVIRFPPGTYRVSSSISSARPSLVIVGDGGGGWSTGSSVRVVTSAPIIVFDLGSATSTELKGAQVSGISVLDLSGTATGAFRVRRQWNTSFRDVSVNGFSRGYAFMLDATGGAISLVRFEAVLGRQNKFGIATQGEVASTYVSPNTYFALTRVLEGSVGVQFDNSSQMFGGVDKYETGVRVLGDGNYVSARLEGNALHVHVAGPVARRNIISGTRFISGGQTASVLIGSSPRIFDTVVMGNTYAAPAAAIVDQSAPGSSAYIIEPQQNHVMVRRSVAGPMRWELRNTRDAQGDGSEWAASGRNGGVQGVLRSMTGSPDTVQVGSTTDHDVQLVRNGRPVATFTSKGFSIGGGTPISRYVSATAAWSPPALAEGGVAMIAISVPGARLGDTTAVSFSTPLPGGVIMSGSVTAPGTVSVTLLNRSGYSLDLGRGEIRADVWQH